MARVVALDVGSDYTKCFDGTDRRPEKLHAKSGLVSVGTEAFDKNAVTHRFFRGRRVFLNHPIQRITRFLWSIAETIASMSASQAEDSAFVMYLLAFMVVVLLIAAVMMRR